jgi:L-fuculose-phosphate aldolase
MSPEEAKLRGDIVGAMQAMDARGLNRGTSGNVSARFGDGMLISPSGIPAAALTEETIVAMGLDEEPQGSPYRPSSEWRMHAGLLAARRDCNAVVHCHSRHATILACAGRGIPSLHYMVGVSGKSTIPLAPYAAFGSAELAAEVARALDGGLA